MSTDVLTLSLSFEGHEFRIRGSHEEPQFVASDVCAALELGNTTMALERLDEDERGISTVETPGGPQSVLMVTEPGLQP